jgi:hypothetical protein
VCSRRHCISQRAADFEQRRVGPSAVPAHVRRRRWVSADKPVLREPDPQSDPDLNDIAAGVDSEHDRTAVRRPERDVRAGA